MWDSLGRSRGRQINIDLMTRMPAPDALPPIVRTRALIPGSMLRVALAERRPNFTVRVIRFDTVRLPCPLIAPSRGLNRAGFDGLRAPCGFEPLAKALTMWARLPGA
mgnify:CR=1 FL=1